MKREKGITLIALVITIIVLIILAGVAINMTLGENGIFTKAQYAKEQYEMAEVKEKLNITILEIQTENGTDVTLDTLLTNLSIKLPKITIEKGGNVLKGSYEGYGFTIDENFKVTIDGYNSSTEESIQIGYTVTFNGINVTSNGVSKVNENETYIAKLTVNNSAFKPTVIIKMGETTLVEGTHYIYENGNLSIASITGNIEITAIAKETDGSWDGTVNSPKIEGTGLTAVYWNGTKWVDLTANSTQEEWENWYDYSTSNKKWANARTADGSMWVWIPRYEYLLDNTNKTITVRFIPTTTNSETEGYTTDSTGIIISSDNYIVHPAFMNDTSNIFANGGWDSDLPGFWIAKYAAGYQNATAGEETREVQYSNLVYTTVNEDWATNYFGGITANTTRISYPVFKANTYAYNLISAGDAYLLSKEIKDVSIYGLTNVDSHMVKNSEWGAVAYLTHSQYGVNGSLSNMNEITMNSKNLNDATKNIYAVTSYGKSDTPNDVTASSTQNMTGVFDLSGCVWEIVAGYYKGGEASLSELHDSMAISSTELSTKYVTLYNEWNNNTIKGDATKEITTSNTGENGWNDDNSNFINSSAVVFIRGGSANDTTRTGIFAFNCTGGKSIKFNGFRVCLAF